MNDFLRNKVWTRRSCPRRKNTTDYDRGCRVGITRDVSDGISGGRNISPGARDSIHGIAANQGVRDGTSPTSSNLVVSKCGGGTRAGAQQNPPPPKGARRRRPVDRNRPDLVI